jgi:hypothetical protein
VILRGSTAGSAARSSVSAYKKYAKIAVRIIMGLTVVSYAQGNVKITT